MDRIITTILIIVIGIVSMLIWKGIKTVNKEINNK
jgi:uncharacterized membrane protein YbhN (UPF0104 family)